LPNLQLGGFFQGKMKPQTQMLFKNRRSSGFTLVELMVVILIIVVLAGLLFPLAQNMKEGTTRTKCVAQFRTWATAISSYAGDNSGRYEVSNVAPVSYTVQDCTPYIEYWAPGLNKADEENYERTPTFDEAVKIHREMRCCPTLNKGGQTPVTITMVTPSKGLVTSVIRPKRGKEIPMSIIKNPSRFMILIETVPGTTATGYNATPDQFATKVKPLTMKGENYRHKGAANVLMADLAVKNMTWREIEKGVSYWNNPG
jgi:prepilin-type N-terminal cleavage/methylation domain-containing protein/prepilin-type processing-associated H-X9-DG protein